MGPQTVLWFAIGCGAIIFSGVLLYQRYVQKSLGALESPGAFALFMTLMALSTIGAFVAGFAAMGMGR